MLTTKVTNCGIEIYANNKLVLTIDEVSDDETINLFLTPNKSIIMKSDFIPDADWTHELLSNIKDHQ